MHIQVPSLADVAKLLPRRAKAVAGYGIAAAVAVGAFAWLAVTFGPRLMDLVGGDTIQMSAFEYSQATEDKRDVGELCEDWDDEADGVACRFEDGCILAKHIVNGRITRIYKLHPDRFGEPPAAPEYRGVRSAGLLGGDGCDPQNACIPFGRHQGSWSPVWESKRSSCWVERRVKWFNQDTGYTDGCMASVPFNACGSYYRWDRARWLCCYYH